MKNKELVLAKILEDITLLSHSVLSPFISEEHLLNYKPIHLCEWYGKLGLEAPKYFIGKTVIPTLTSSACTNVLYQSATANGNITATGGSNPTVRGFVYMQGDTGDPTVGMAGVSETGSFGTGAFSLSLVSLRDSTYYRVRAYATNSAGTGYAPTVQLITKYVATVAQGNPTNGGTEDSTPVLYMTGSDQTGEEVEYEVQVDTVNTFNSQAAANKYLKYLKVRLQKVGSPTGSLYAIIRSGSNSGTIVGTSENRTMSEFVADPLLYGKLELFTFSTPIELTIGTSYYIQLLRTANYDSSNRCNIMLKSAGYAGGVCYEYNTSWTEYIGVDVMFQLLDSNYSILIDADSTTNSGSDPLCGEPSGTFSRIGQSFTAPNTATPLKDKFSAIPDAGFYHDGSDTHPFTQAHEITFTGQAGDELPADDTYYWRVRTRDVTYPVWSNWSAIKSFIVPPVLVVQDATHAHTADSLELTPHAGGNELVVENASQSHTSDIVALVQHNILSVQDASHAIISDNIQFATLLVVSNTSHLHTAQTPTLVEGSPVITIETSNAHDFGSDTTPRLEFNASDSFNHNAMSFATIILEESTGKNLEAWCIQTYNDVRHEYIISEYDGIAEIFSPLNTGLLNSVKFRLKRTVAADGNLVAYLYSTTINGGLYIPLSLLATSSNVAASTLSTSDYTEIEFTFPSGQNYNMSSSTHYGIFLKYIDVAPDKTIYVETTDNTNYIAWMHHTYPSGWSGSVIGDVYFKLYSKSNGYVEIIEAASGITDGFENIDTPADTNPFNNTDTIGYTVQVDDALPEGTYAYSIFADCQTGYRFSGWTTLQTFIISDHTVLVVSDGSQLQTSDNIALTQHNILVVENALQTQISDLFSLILDLVVSDSEQLHTVQSPNLVQAYILLIDNIEQLQTTDNIVLVQHNLLIVQDSSQLQVSDEPTIVFHNAETIVLSISNPYHETYSDLINLGLSITINNSEHLQFCQNITLLENPIIYANNTEHLFYSDEITLTPILIIDDTLQLQTTDAIMLLQNPLLVVGNTSQLHTATNITLQGLGNKKNRVLNIITNA